MKLKIITLGLSLITIAGLLSTGSFNFVDEQINKDIRISSSSEYTEVSADKNLPVDLTDKNFEETIGEGVTLVDFWATWCGPCRRQAPIIKELAKEIGDKATIAKLDVDKNRTSAGKYYVRSIPTIIVFKDGKVVERLVGMRKKDELLKVVKRHLVVKKYL